MVTRLVSPIYASFVGQPILAAAGFQPALFTSLPASFRRQRRSREGPSPARVSLSVVVAFSPG